jgi:hypothetical protein
VILRTDVRGVWLMLVPLPPEATLRNWYNRQKNYKTFLVYNRKLSERGYGPKSVPFIQVGERPSNITHLEK